MNILVIFKSYVYINRESVAKYGKKFTISVESNLKDMHKWNVLHVKEFVMLTNDEK